MIKLYKITASDKKMQAKFWVVIWREETNSDFEEY
jgi:hypothetical protein